MISININFKHRLLNNRLQLIVESKANNVTSGDTLEISYQVYDYNTESWGASNVFRSSSKINNGSILIKNVYSTDIAKKLLFRTKVIRDSQIIYDKYFPEVILDKEFLNAPDELNLNTSSNTLSWSYNQNPLDLPLDHFIVLCNYKNYLDITDNFTIHRTVSKDDRSYVFDNLRSGDVSFSIVAVNVEGKESKIQLFNNTKILHKITVDQGSSVQLFDKSSWETLNYKNIKSALDLAADRWNALVNFNPNVAQTIKKFIERITNNTQTFNGIRLVYFSTESPIENDPAGARCGPISFIKLSEYEYNTMTFGLLVLANPDDYTFEYMVDLMVHELGHAAGIGAYWNSPPASNQTLNIDNTYKFPYSINSQNQIIYKRTQQAYNNRYQFEYPKYHIPINDNGMGQGAHWAHLINETNNFTKGHPAPTYDIMSYGDSSAISELSVKFLMDIGYRENYTNASEYPLDIIPIQDPNPPLGVGQICGGISGINIFDNPAIDISGSDTIYNDENIDLEPNFDYPTPTPTTPTITPTIPTTPIVETTSTPTVIPEITPTPLP